MPDRTFLAFTQEFPHSSRGYNRKLVFESGKCSGNKNFDNELVNWMFLLQTVSGNVVFYDNFHLCSQDFGE